MNVLLLVAIDVDVASLCLLSFVHVLGNIYQILKGALLNHPLEIIIVI